MGNKLSINVAKTEHMFFGSNFRLSSLEKTVPIFLGHKQIKRVKHTKYLGSYLDENLKWEEHIDNINVREGGGGTATSRLVSPTCMDNSLAIESDVP